MEKAPARLRSAARGQDADLRLLGAIAAAAVVSLTFTDAGVRIVLLGQRISTLFPLTGSAGRALLGLAALAVLITLLAGVLASRALSVLGTLVLPLLLALLTLLVLLALIVLLLALLALVVRCHLFLLRCIEGMRRSRWI
jgi:hypothetical protein